MYELIPYISSVVFILLGGFMLLFPTKALKKEDRDSEEKIKKCRRNGIMIQVLGILLFVMCHFFN